MYIVSHVYKGSPHLVNAHTHHFFFVWEHDTVISTRYPQTLFILQLKSYQPLSISCKLLAPATTFLLSVSMSLTLFIYFEFDFLKNPHTGDIMQHLLFSVWIISLSIICWGIDAFKLWCWRRLLRVPRTARRLNQSILKELTVNIHWKD